MSLLSVCGITKRFGGVTALESVDFEVTAGEIVSVIGPNGAGKTTLFNVLTGFYSPEGGTIVFSGERVDGLSPHRITQRGIARTFQNIRLFRSMTALENVMVGRHCRTRSELCTALFRTQAFYREEREIGHAAREHLKAMGLEDQATRPARHLSYGDQRRLEIARALATEPKLLLLDEPNAGLNSQESHELMGTLERIRREGVTILLIEHAMKVVMGVSDRVVVLDYGRKIAEGTPAEVQNNIHVIEAYLGIPGTPRA